MLIDADGSQQLGGLVLETTQKAQLFVMESHFRFDINV